MHLASDVAWAADVDVAIDVPSFPGFATMSGAATSTSEVAPAPRHRLGRGRRDPSPSPALPLVSCLASCSTVLPLFPLGLSSLVPHGRRGSLVRPSATGKTKQNSLRRERRARRAAADWPWRDERCDLVGSTAPRRGRVWRHGERRPWLDRTEPGDLGEAVSLVVVPSASRRSARRAIRKVGGRGRGSTFPRPSFVRDRWAQTRSRGTTEVQR